MSGTVTTIEARKLSFLRGRRTILDAVDLAFGTGELVALLGRNGAGKSSLLRLLLGLERPKEGQILLGGAPLASLAPRDVARRIAYVPQSHLAPFPYKVREVVAMGRLAERGFLHAPTGLDRDLIEGTLQHLRIGHLAERPYTQLSGGERQLVMIARAMTQGAKLLVMDEPVNGLDYGHQRRLLDDLARLAAAGYGVLMTSHHPDHARQVASRVVMLHRGRVMADGRPGDLLTDDILAELYDLPS